MLDIAKKFPRIAEEDSLLATMLEEQSDINGAAQKAFTAWRKAPDKLELLITAANIFIYAGRAADAIRHLQDAILHGHANTIALHERLVYAYTEHDIHILQEKLTWFRVHSTGIMNDGGPSLRNTIRAENEISFLLELYRQLDSPDDWLAVFPEAKQYVVDGRIIPDYALAHICISTHIPAYTQYGLHLLALSMDTEEQISAIYRLYTFTANDYIDLCARSRVFHDQPLAVLHRPMFQIMHNYTPIEKYTQQLDLFTYADKSFHIAFSIALLPEDLTQEPYTVFVNISSSIGWICQLSSCTVDGVPQKAIPQGSQKTSEGDAFFSNAPLYALPNLARGSILEFKGSLQAISTQALLEQNAKLERMVLRMSQRLKEGKR